MDESTPAGPADGPDAGPFFALSTQPMAVVSRDGRWVRVNPAFDQIFGWQEYELRGQAVLRLVHPDDHGLLDQILNGAELGEIELHLLTEDGAFRAGRWRFTTAPDSGVVLALMETSRPNADRTQVLSRYLANEIEHRVRNNLAVIRSIIRRTAESTTDEEAFVHLQGRIDAYARVQSGLTFVDDRHGVDLALLVEDELLAHSMREGERLKIDGPDVALTANAAEAIGLALHELAMNAVKFGAICEDEARLEVRWSVETGDDGGVLLFTWSESGLALNKAPLRGDGFGMETLLRSLPYDLGAETKVDFRPEGLQFTMSVPLTRIAASSTGGDVSGPA